MSEPNGINYPPTPAPPTPPTPPARPTPPRPKWVRFNVNDHVRVKLTEHGRELWRIYHACYPAAMQPVDADGWLCTQMHVVMHAFGPHCINGGRLCFETTIEIEELPTQPLKCEMDVSCSREAVVHVRHNSEVPELRWEADSCHECLAELLRQFPLAQVTLSRPEV